MYGIFLYSSGLDFIKLAAVGSSGSSGLGVANNRRIDNNNLSNVRAGLQLYFNISINFANNYRLLKTGVREYIIRIMFAAMTFSIIICIRHYKFDNLNIEKLLKDFEWRKVIEYWLALLFAKLKL